MPRSINKVTLIGHVGKDPEAKYLPSGVLVAQFSVATSERFKDKAGEVQERTEWHNLQAFGKTAEIVRDYVKKGSQIYAEGKLQTRSWEKDGYKHYRTEIALRELVLLGGPKEKPNFENGYAGAKEAYHSDAAEPAPADSAQITDDDIPF